MNSVTCFVVTCFVEQDVSRVSVLSKTHIQLHPKTTKHSSTVNDRRTKHTAQLHRYHYNVNTVQ